MSRTKHYTMKEAKPHRQAAQTRLTKNGKERYFPFINPISNNGNQRGQGMDSLGRPLSKRRKVIAEIKVMGRRRERRRRNRGDFDGAASEDGEGSPFR